jgi:hypothetical protein
MDAVFRALACACMVAGVVAAGPPAPNRVVVLDNENLIEGEVTRVDDGYEIHRPVGGDMTLPAKRVLAVVADRKAAFAVVAERANRRDADERLRLAKWCSNNGLMEEALSEAQTAARMRPGFTAAEQLVRSLQSMPQATPATPDPAVVRARAETPAKETVTDVPAIDYNSESFPLFASKVNAVLMNACATCHARDDAKAFRLNRLGGRTGATKNLMAALPHVNPANPAASPILVKAVTAHGSAAEAPFKTRSHPAYQTLETWVRVARAPEGTPLPEAPLFLPAAIEPRKLPDLGPETRGPVVPAAAKGDAFGQDSKSLPRPDPTRPKDEFDPAIFNGQAKTKK